MAAPRGPVRGARTLTRTARDDASPTGLLHLGFEAGADGTRLAHQVGRAPLRCVRAFGLPSGERVAQLLHVGPGVMAGDRLDLRVDVASGARALLVAQSAAKLHAMRGDAEAHQRVTLHVGPGASLEYHPGLTIPFAGTAYRQRIEVDLAEGARFVMVERWSAGRVARGERHAYRRVESHVRVRRGGQLVYADALVLDPADADGPAVFDARAYLACAVRVGGSAETVGRVAAEPHVDTAHYGSDAVDVVRASADDGVALQRALTRAWCAWRAADALPSIALERYGS